MERSGRPRRVFLLKCLLGCTALVGTMLLVGVFVQVALPDSALLQTAVLLVLGLALSALVSSALAHEAPEPVAEEAPEPEARTRELEEVLEQQAATGGILRVIASTPTDLAPVFETILANATRLCEARLGLLYLHDEAGFRLVAHRGGTAAFAEFLRQGPIQAGPRTGLGRLARERWAFQIEDVAGDPAWEERDPLRVATVEIEGARSVLFVPMLKETTLIGALVIHRREVRPFTERQLQLVATFADQAVIAIENVRLFQELQARNRDLTEALERQTATGEILQVISSSPTDVQPTFDAIAVSATRLCGAANGAVLTFDGSLIHLRAHHGSPRELNAIRRVFPLPPGRGSATARAILTRAVVHVDIADDPEYAQPIAQAGFRTVLSVPMLREGNPIGAITVSRQEGRPFSEPQIALLRTFADQAVIAIENARLFQELEIRNRELTEALEQQTATGEILGTMSGSPTDVRPVFDAIVRSAVRLCDGLHSNVYRIEDDLIHLVAHHNFSPAALFELESRYPLPVEQAPSLVARAIRERAVVNVEDAQTDPAVPEISRRVVFALGDRSVLYVPMLREGTVIGVVVVSRGEIRPFSDKEVALLRTFADQAVIAIENVRLFQELQARNRELTESLDHQTATAEILRVISRSPTDTQPVFDAVVASAARLCDGRLGVLYRLVDDQVHVVALYNASPEGARLYQQLYPRPLDEIEPIVRSRVYGQTPEPIHLVDVDVTPGVTEAFRERARIVGVRSAIMAPMLREGQVIGGISVSRAGPDRSPHPFSAREIALLQVFADQAVIAIENVRLFEELQGRNRALGEALEQQTATSEVLKVISSSPTDVQPVFETIARNAVRLCDAVYCAVFQVDGDRIDLVAHHNIPSEGVEELRRRYPAPLSATTKAAQTARERVVLQISDLASDPTVTEAGRQLARMVGYRSQAFVPMLRGDRTLGVITLSRREAEPFPAQHITLLRTFADQAVIAIENVRLFQDLQARNQELTGALDRQAATSEILQVISRSPTAAEPVFEAIVKSASRLLGGAFAVLTNVREGALHVVAHELPSVRAEPVREWLRTWPRPLDDESQVVTAVRTGQGFSVADAHSEPDTPRVLAVVRALPFRGLAMIPMLKDGQSIGGIVVARPTVGSFSDVELALLRTFADQAVIAIENVRLFQDLQARNRELTEALEQQTATAEVLQVISRSPTDAQPVFDAILASAVRLCGGRAGAVFRVEEGVAHLVALANPVEGAHALQRAAYPRPVDQVEPATRRVVTEGVVVHLPDIEQEPGLSEAFLERARTGGYRSLVGVPMLRENRITGAISVSRAGPGRTPSPFSEREIALLQVFAAQAVIAIENVRLFTELREKHRALTEAHAQVTEALEQQTATAEILQVISGALTDAQPVFDMIVERAVRLCRGTFGIVYLAEGGAIRDAAHYNINPEMLAALRVVFPKPLDRSTPSGQAILERRVVHLADVPETLGEDAVRVARLGGIRGNLVVPLLRGGEAIGTLSVARAEPGAFSEKQIALLKTFGDQAVIAIENVRLFRELRRRTDELTRSVEELRALGEVGRAVSSTLDLETVLSTIVSRANQLAGTDGGAIYEYEEETRTFHLRTAEGLEDELLEALRATPVRLGEGAMGRAGAERAPVQIPDIFVPGAYEGRLRGLLERAGFRAILAVPLLREETVVGALIVRRREAGSFPEAVVNLLQTFATQSVLAIQHARLFREIEDKSRQLEVASRHKSQFLANMSHELRTPLNAILGYTELILDSIYGDVPEPVREVMERISRSGHHLLGLINDVLDLSKIEAGQLVLFLADYSLEDVVQTVATAVEALAAEKGLTLTVTLAPDLPPGLGDERRIAQVLLNLVGNAIKFTEAGEVRVEARATAGAFLVSVADTGPGIAEADQRKIFEEFQQADSSSTRKKGGTGLGLSIARRIVEMHGGRIWVESRPGQGATFAFTLPVRVECPASPA